MVNEGDILFRQRLRNFQYLFEQVDPPQSTLNLIFDVPFLLKKHILDRSVHFDFSYGYLLSLFMLLRKGCPHFKDDLAHV